MRPCVWALCVIIHTSETRRSSFPATYFLLFKPQMIGFSCLVAVVLCSERCGHARYSCEALVDLFTEVPGQVTVATKVAVVGVAAGDERHVDVEQCMSAVA